MGDLIKNQDKSKNKSDTDENNKDNKNDIPLLGPDDPEEKEEESPLKKSKENE